ncbi:MAG: gamma subclass chorismate mutase AroQ [Chthoniobacterales bacterium]
MSTRPVLVCCLTITAFLVTNAHAWPGKSSAFQPSAQEARLVQLMGDRLEVSRKVAWAKYLDTLPIYDPKREKESLASITQSAAHYGLPASTVTSFFKAQMNASKQYQTHLLRKWKRGAQPFPALPFLNLKSQLRPEIDRINQEMLKTLTELKNTPATSQHQAAFAAYARSVLRTQRYSWRIADTSIAPLRYLSPTHSY